ncbi:putative T7SS-secreted protein [Streptomyces sp. NBC_01615]|uniref:putative T7SS-secreted protein n=1 Tax=Streptomyces sp. NBC_01615 TaxID=2975898 RepID=UPI00386B0AC6
MARPTDWSPLAEQDPVPGDAHDIRGESRRLGKLAQMISEQVERLNAIGRDTTELKGKYADAMRDKAEELSGRLGKTHHRYDHVSGYLAHWADDLEDCQKQADDALSDAKEARGRVDAHKPPDGPRKPDSEMSEAEKTTETARLHALTRAEDDLGAARNKLDKAVSHRDERAGHWAGKIKRAISKDGLHDKGWDKFKNWVNDHARLLNDLANVLVWVATACAIVALFIPGLNILAMIALGATIGSLLLHTATALSGSGSWIDVGLDVFALATFGLGRLATPGLEAAEGGLRAALRGGAGKLGQAAWDAAKLSTRADRAAASRLLKTAVKGSQEWEGARTALSKGMKTMWAEKKSAFADAMKLADVGLPKLGALENILGGGPEAAALKAYTRQVVTRFPGAADLTAEITKGAGAIRLSQGAFAAGTSVDAFDKAVGMTGPYFSGGSWVGSDNPWIHAKTWATQEVGSSW